MGKQKFLYRFLIYSFTSIILLFSLATALLQIPAMRESAVQLAFDQIYSQTGWKIRAKSVSGFLPFHFRADEVTITSPHSLAIAMEHLDAYYSPVDLIQRHFTSPYICAKEITIFNHSFDAEGQIDFSISDLGLSARLLISFLDLPINPTNINIRGSQDAENYLCSVELTQRPDIVIKGTLAIDSNLRVKESDINLYAKDIQDLEILRSLPLKGKISAHIEISGQVLHPTLAIEVNSPHLDIFGYPFSDVAFDALATATQDQFVSPFMMQAKIADELVVLSSQISWNWGCPVKISEIAGSFGSLLLSGKLDIHPPALTAEGSLQLEIENMGELEPFLGPCPTGKAELAVKFHSDQQNKQNVDAIVEVFHCLFGPVKAEYGKGIFKFSDLFHSPFGSIMIGAKQIECGSMTWRECSLATHRSPSNDSLWPYSFSVSGNWHGETQLIASGGWQATKDILDFSLDVFTGKGGNYPIHLKDSAHFHLDPYSITLEPIEVNIGEGKILAAISTNHSKISGNVKADLIPIEILNLFILPQISAKGTVSANAEISGTPSLIIGKARAKFNNIFINEEIFSKFPSLDGQLVLEIDGKSLKTAGSISGGNLSLANWNGEIPFTLSLLPLQAAIDSDGKIKGSCTAEGEVSEIFQLFVTDTTSITGYAKMQIDLDGTWQEPSIRGTAQWIEGTYESLNSGAVIQNIQAYIEAQEDKIFLKELQANTGKNGTIQASGSMRMDQKNQFPFEFTAHLNKAALIRLDYAQMAASGKLACGGSLDKMILSGDISLDQAMIRIPDKLPVPLQTVEVTYVKKNQKEPKQTSLVNTSSGHFHLILDIHLSIPGKAFVNGKDLSTEWKGDIYFSGTPENPLAYGTAEIIRGEYLFNGREFIASNGVITFAGDPAKKTTIYLVAERDIENNKIESILKGPINDPKLSLRSNPPLPEREILSWILFNRGASEITGFQRSELNSTEFTLSAGKGDTDMLSRIRSTVGIDRVDISKSESGESDEVSLRFGKYLSKGVFISLNKSLNAEKNQIAIEANLFRNIKAQAEVGDNSEAKMSLKWIKDY